MKSKYSFVVGTLVMLSGISLCYGEANHSKIRMSGPAEANIKIFNHTLKIPLPLTVTRGITGTKANGPHITTEYIVAKDIFGNRLVQSRTEKETYGKDEVPPKTTETLLTGKVFGLLPLKIHLKHQKQESFRFIPSSIKNTETGYVVENSITTSGRGKFSVTIPATPVTPKTPLNVELRQEPTKKTTTW